MALINFTLNEKRQIINEGLRKCMTNRLCGNYFDMTDLDPKYGCIEWGVYDFNNGKFRLVAYTPIGEYSQVYDFDFTFDENLQVFYDYLVEYILDSERAEVL